MADIEANENKVATEEPKQEIKKLSDLDSVKVVLVFSDGGGFVVPLSTLQGAFLVRMMGFTINNETGELSHYTDLDLNNIYHLLSEEDLKKMME